MPPAPPAARSPTRQPAAVNGEPIGRGELMRSARGTGRRRDAGESARCVSPRSAAKVDDLLLQQFLRERPEGRPRCEQASQRGAEGLKKQGKTLTDFLKESGMTEAQVRADIVNILQWRDYVQAKISEADVKKYYYENKDHFDRVVVRASHIVLRVPAGSSDGERQAAVAKLQGLRQEIAAGKIDFAWRRPRSTRNARRLRRAATSASFRAKAVDGR
jgi:hypothetical protein